MAMTLRTMNGLVAQFAKRLHVKTMLWGVALVVMVLLRGLSAPQAGQQFGRGEFARTDRVIHGGARFDSLGEFLSVFSDPPSCVFVALLASSSRLDLLLPLSRSTISGLSERSRLAPFIGSGVSSAMSRLTVSATTLESVRRVPIPIEAVDALSIAASATAFRGNIAQYHSISVTQAT